MITKREIYAYAIGIVVGLTSAGVVAVGAARAWWYWGGFEPAFVGEARTAARRAEDAQEAARRAADDAQSSAAMVEEYLIQLDPARHEAEQREARRLVRELQRLPAQPPPPRTGWWGAADPPTASQPAR